MCNNQSGGNPFFIKKREVKRMKQKWIIMMLILAFAGSLTGCGRSKAAKLSDAGLLMRAAEYSDMDLLIKNGHTLRVTLTMPDGSEETTYMSENYYDVCGMYGNYIDDGSEIFGSINGESTIRCFLLDDDAKKVFRDANEYRKREKESYQQTETIVERKVKDKIMTYQSQIPISDSAAISMVQTYQIDPAEVDYIEINRSMDAEDFRTYHYDSYAVAGGEYRLLLQKEIVYDTEPDANRYQELHDLVFGGNTHTITIIKAPGTKQEQRYVKTANEKVMLDVWIEDKDGNYCLYEDKECTKAVEYKGLDEGQVMFDTDKTLYMK